MSVPVVLRPEAQADLLQARDWYERQRAGLGDEFAEAFADFLGRIRAAPEMHAVALLGVRRGKLRRFPYVVYYRLLVDRIEVIAVLHGSRDPRVWRSRASPGTELPG